MLRLKPTIERVATLAPPTIGDMYALFARYYAQADEARFRSDLAQKQRVILLRNADGALGGFSTVRVLEPKDVGRPCRILYSGDTVVDQAYWGDKSLHTGFTMLLFRERFGRPGTPLYWLLTTKGYRTYLLLTNYFRDAWPRFDRRTPPEIAALMQHLGSRRYGDAYEPERGIIRHGGALDHLRPGVADIRPDDLDDPHIRFFAEHNPNHAAGDELLCLARVHMSDPVRIAARIARRRWQGHRTRSRGAQP